jgi:hypothetical protein
MLGRIVLNVENYAATYKTKNLPKKNISRFDG